MTIDIPVWLIWTVGLLIGVPAVLIILVLAYVGWELLGAIGSRFK